MNVQMNKEQHWDMCKLFRMKEHWMFGLMEVEKLINVGLPHQLLMIFKAEVLLNIWSFEEAQKLLAQVLKGEFPLKDPEFTFGMTTEAYKYVVYARILMALGSFKDALEAAKEASEFDPLNVEVQAVIKNVEEATKSLDAGNNFYQKKKNYKAAYEQYKSMKKSTDQYTIMKRMISGEHKDQKIYAGPRNALRLNNLAACCWKLQKFEKCKDYCNRVIRAWPDHLISTVLLLYRAVSYFKLGMWQNCVWDMETVSVICHRDVKIGRHFEIEDSKMRKTGVLLTGTNLTKAPTIAPSDAPSDNEKDKPLSLEGEKDNTATNSDKRTEVAAVTDVAAAKSEMTFLPVDAPAKD